MTIPSNSFSFGAINLESLSKNSKAASEEFFQIAKCNNPNVLEQEDFYAEGGCYTLIKGEENPVSLFKNYRTEAIFYFLQLKEKEIHSKWPHIDLKRLAGIIAFHSFNVFEIKKMVNSLIHSILDFNGSETDFFYYIVGKIYTYTNNKQLNHDSEFIELGQSLFESQNEINRLKIRIKDHEKKIEYDKAQLLARKALEITEKFYTSDSLAIVYRLNELAKFLYNHGNYQEAKILMERALKICEETLDPHHPLTLASLNGLALLLDDQAQYQEAKILIERALKNCELVFGPNHVETATSLNNLASIVQNQGNYREAKNLMERSLAIVKSVLEPNHLDMAMNLNNLAFLLQMQGDYQEAINLMEQALKICEETLDPNHPLTALSLNNLAMLFTDQGNYEEAKPLLVRALKINETTLDPNHPDIAKNLNNLALILKNLGDLQEAKSLYNRALKIYETTFGLNHPDVANSINNLASFLEGPDNYEEAKLLYERSLEIYETTLGPHHPTTAISLNNLAMLHQHQDNYEEAKPLLERALYIRTSNANTIVSSLSERERMIYLQAYRFSLDFYLSIFEEPQVDEKAYLTTLQWKGLSGQIEASYRKIILENPETQNLFFQLNQTRQKISNIMYSPYNPDLTSKRREELDKLTQQKEKLERELLQKSDEFKKEQLLTQPNLEELIQAIPHNDNTIIVDYLRYDRFVIGEAPHYLAFILKPGNPPTLHRIDLGPADKIEEAIASYRDKINSNLGNSFGDAQIEKVDQAVRAAIWDPVQKYVDKNQTVLIVPDASIAGISFAGLRSEADRYLIEDYTFGYLENATDLIRLKMDDTPLRSGALVVGNVDYNNQTTDAVSDSEQTRSVACGLKQWSQLSRTKDEIDQVSDLLKNKQQVVSKLETDKAGELNVKNEMSQKRYLHFATHGFFAENCPVATDSHLDGSDFTFQDSNQNQFVGYNPMILSGLVLAGANKNEESENEEPKMEDGILTAEEIIGLDLRGTELAVLSACQTGLGAIASGEGILGLRRAFTQAGAQSLVMSLWNATDEPTQKLMQIFYDNLLNSKEANTLEALRQAQLQILENNRKQFGNGRPYTWAEFIASGEVK